MNILTSEGREKDMLITSLNPALEILIIIKLCMDANILGVNAGKASLLNCGDKLVASVKFLHIKKVLKIETKMKLLSTELIGLALKIEKHTPEGACKEATDIESV